jgi:hypothetical protein
MDECPANFVPVEVIETDVIESPEKQYQLEG